MLNLSNVSGEDIKRYLNIPKDVPVFICRLYRFGGGITKRVYLILFNSVKSQPFSPFAWYSEVNSAQHITGVYLRYGPPIDGYDLVKRKLQTYVSRPVPIERFSGDLNNSLLIPIDLSYFFRDKTILSSFRVPINEEITSTSLGGGEEPPIPENPLGVHPTEKQKKIKRGRVKRKKKRRGPSRNI